MFDPLGAKIWYGAANSTWRRAAAFTVGQWVLLSAVASGFAAPPDELPPDPPPAEVPEHTRPAAPTTTPQPVLPTRPLGDSGELKSRRLGTTQTAETSPLPSDLVFEGLPANAVTIRSLIGQKRLRKALKVAEMVLRREPRNVEVGMQKARLFYWLKRTDAAEKQATEVYKLDRHNTDALRLVGDIRLQRGDEPGAIRAYREAILRGAADYDLRLRLMDLYIGADRPDLAQVLLRPGMELPDELAWRLARALYRLNQLINGLEPGLARQ